VASSNEAAQNKTLHQSKNAWDTKQKATHTRGNDTAQSDPGICHSGGINGVEKIAIATSTKKHSTNASQNRFSILGTSMKKLDRSTSFLVAPHVML
jgi:hypothetical protein